jgi:hypothetical protein
MDSQWNARISDPNQRLRWRWRELAERVEYAQRFRGSVLNGDTSWRPLTNIYTVVHAASHSEWPMKMSAIHTAIREKP